MKIILLTIGTPPQKSPAKEWAEAYQKKITQLFPQLDFEWQSIKALSLEDLPQQKIVAEKWVEQHLQKEAAVIDKYLQKIHQKAPVQIILFDKMGATLSSELWALWLQKYTAWNVPAHVSKFLLAHSFPKIFSAWLTGLSANQQLVFVIGGPFGLHTESLLKSWAHQAVKISFGPITLPHDLALVTCLEQLYRALTILRGEPYHVLYNFST